MGTVIRLKNVSINESPLGRISPQYLAGVKLAYTSRGSLSDSLLVPTGITPKLVGSPSFNSGYVQGDGHTDYINSGFVRDTNKSFTACVVLRRSNNPANLQMYFGDYQQRDVGFGIMSSNLEGLRPALPATGLFPTRPQALKNAPANQWLYAVFRYDLEKHVVSFYCPSLGVKMDESFSGNPQPALSSIDPLTIAGGRSGNLDNKSDVAFVAFYDRALTDSELDLQQSKAVDYCKSVGVNVML